MERGSTRGEKKILLQFERFVETDFFHQEVKRIRKVTGLPAKGIEPTAEDVTNLSNFFRVPDRYPIKKKSGGQYPLKTLNIESRKLQDALPISNVYLSWLVKYYIIFNRFFYDELKELEQYFHTANVCEITDAQSEFDEYAPSEDPDDFYGSYSIRAYIEMLENKLWRYPVALRIHADASQRDIIEFIKEHWGEIQEYQSRYGDRNKLSSFKNSKTKTNKETKDRNAFIYKHRNLPSREISRLLADEKGMYLDVGHILKIISLEKQKREKK